MYRAGRLSASRHDGQSACLQYNLIPGGIESLPMEQALHLAVIDEQHDGIGGLIIHLVSGHLVSGDLWQAV